MANIIDYRGELKRLSLIYSIQQIATVLEVSISQVRRYISGEQKPPKSMQDFIFNELTIALDYKFGNEEDIEKTVCHIRAATHSEIERIADETGVSIRTLYRIRAGKSAYYRTLKKVKEVLK